MKCYIDIDESLYNKIVKENSRYKGNISTGARTLLYCDKNMINFLKPYIKTEKFDKREIHFKNTRYTGILIHQFSNFKISEKELIKSNFKGEIYNRIMENACFRLENSFCFNSIKIYMFGARISCVPFDEYKLLKHYLRNYNKWGIDLTEDFYNELITITEFILKQIKGDKTYCNYDIEIPLNIIRKNDVIVERVKGQIDIIDDNCIYDIKCNSSDKKYKSIMQVLIYLCMIYRKNFFGTYDIKQIKVINPIINVVHSIDIEDFGVNNLLKFFKIVFSDYIENKKVEIINFD